MQKCKNAKKTVVSIYGQLETKIFIRDHVFGTKRCFDKFKGPTLPGAKYGPPQWLMSFKSPVGIGLTKYPKNFIGNKQV